MKRLLLVLAAAVALAACDSKRPPPAERIALAPCRLPGVESTALCGKHEVWEDREARSGRRLVLSIAVVPAKLRAKEPDPVVVLAGGPGQGAISLARQVMPLFARLNDARDVVFVDQRGTGASHPLHCEEEKGTSLQSLFEDAIPEKLVRQCLKGLQADLRLYVTTIAMADLDEVRERLGYDKLNLWGGSYGTRAALEFARRYPQRVRTMTLDGVAPPSMKLPLSFVSDGDAAFERLLQSCERDPLCGSTYPDLRATIIMLRGELAKRPARVRIQDPRTGERQTITVNETVFLSGLFRPLYVPELASLLPFGVMAASNGDFNPLLAQNLELADEIAENLALGMHLSVICAEDVPRITPQDLVPLATTFFGQGLINDFMRACSLWPRGSVPADYYDPVRAPVPALILSGGLDPATPPRHGEEVARALPRSRHFVAPQLGHGVSTHGCAPRLIEDFIRKASAEGLDGRCLERIPRPLFVLPLASRLAGSKGAARP